MHQGPEIVFCRSDCDGAYSKSTNDFHEDFCVSLSFYDPNVPLTAAANPLIARLKGTPGGTPKPNGGLPPRTPAAAKVNGSHSGDGWGTSNGTADGLKPKSSFYTTRSAFHSTLTMELVKAMESMQDLFVRMCPEPLVFKAGDVVMCPRDFGEEGCEKALKAGDLVYIESGSGVWDVAGTGQHDLGVEGFASMSGMPQGAGDILNLTDFLAGVDADGPEEEERPWHSVFRVCTNKMVVRVVYGTGRVPELEIGGAKAVDLVQMYMVMARQLYVSSMRLQKRLERLAVMSHAKHDATDEPLPRAIQARRTVELVEKFRIPATERMIETALVHRLMSGEGDRENAQPQAVFGQIVVFSNWLVFSGPSGVNSDIAIPIASVVDVQVDQDHVTVNINSEMSDSPRSSATVKSLTGLPRQPSFKRQGAFGLKLGSRKGSMEQIKHALTGGEGRLSLVFQTSSHCASPKIKTALQRRSAETKKASSAKDLLRSFKVGSNISSGSENGGTGPRTPKAGGTGFEFCDEDGERELVLMSQQINMQEGQLILKEGEMGEMLFHIVSGEVFMLDHQSLVTGKLVAGDLLGAESFLDTGNHGHATRVVAGKNVQLLAFTYDKVQTMLTHNKAVGCAVYRRIASTLASRLSRDLGALESWQHLVSTLKDEQEQAF
mmetsp:Transcript_45129/g.113107  ORF Transcript_45129/g.113107 Transcript_45129/m.113107 type:complete len:662 (-) Transcript_45129:305-2290(-)